MDNPSKPSNSKPDMTSEEMINHSSTWTLALDNALLDRLKEFSEIVDTASQEINTECETLSKDINSLQSRVFNVTNEFLMLSNTQFVENRVQEFEETVESNIVPQTINNGKIKTKTEKEAELIAKMKEAIQIGVSIDIQHDKMQLPGNQKEDGLPQLKIPHLIGTSKFFSSKYCGLEDESKSALSIADQSSINTNVPSPNPYIRSNSAESLPSVHPSLDNASNGNVSPEFRHPQLEASDDHSSRHSNSSLKHQSYSIDSAKESTTTNDERSIKPSSTKATNSIVDDLNNAFRARLPPPPVDDSESDDDFKPSTNEKRLFGDDDDDLFGENSLFANRDIEENFLFGKHVSNTVYSSDRTSNNQSLFRDSEDVYDKVRQSSESENIPPTNTSEKPSESNVKPPGEVKPKIPAGAVPMFGGLPSAKTPVLSSLNSKADKPEGAAEKPIVSSSEGIKGVADSSQHNEKQNKTSQSSLTSDNQQDSKHAGSLGSLSDRLVPHSVKSQPKPKITSLFDDNSDDDMFAPSKLSYGKKSNNSGLFDDDVVNRNLSKKAPLKSKGRLKHSIFEDSDSGDDLFSSASSSSSKSKEKPTVSNANQFFKPALSIFTGRATESLFDDEDIFSSVQNVKGDIIVSKNSNSSDKSDPKLSLPTVTAESISSTSVVDSVVQEGKPLGNDSQVISLSTEESKNKVDESQIKSVKDGVKEQSELDSDTNHPGKQDTISTALADSKISKQDAKISDMNKKSGGTVKDTLQSKPEGASSSVIRPQSLHIQPDKHLSSEKAIVKADNALQPDNNTADGNSKSRQERVKALSSQIASPKEIGKSLLSPSTDAEKEIGKRKSSVKSLANTLKINPLALRPGSRPPKSSESVSQQSQSSEAVSPLPTPSESVSQTPISSGLISQTPKSSESESQTSTSEETIHVPNESNGLLSSVAKSRPKILQRRRPPSRKLRKSNCTTESIIENEEATENDAKPDSGNNTPSLTVDVPIFNPEDHSEPTSPIFPAEILSPSTEEEDIFSIGIGTNQHSAFGVEIASPDDDDSLSKTKGNNLENEEDVNQIAATPISDDVAINNPSEAKIIKPVSDVLQNNYVPEQTSRPLPHTNRKLSNSTRITLPSSKITQCSDSDSDDLFSSSISRKISRDSSLKTSKVPADGKLIEDLFADDSLVKQPIDSHMKSTQAIPKTLTQRESSETVNVQTSKKETGKLNGQNRAIKTTKSLFSDSDNDEDIFMAKSKSVTQKVQDKVEKQVVDSASSKLSSKQKGIFDSDSDEDNLFGAKGKKTVSANSAPSQNVSTSSKSTSVIKSSRAAHKSLFSDSSDDDIFTSSSSTTKTSAIKKAGEKQTTERPVKKSSEDIFDDPLNNI